MSKIFLIGDTHIGLGYPNNADKWFKVHREYFSDFLMPLLKSRVEPGDIIVHLGDLFDNRNVIPINLMNYTLDIVEEISKIAPFHIIIGNHDLYSKSTGEINSVRPFKHIDNIFIYDKPTKIEFEGIGILMVPYIDNRKEQISIINNNKDCKYLFCHSDLNGAKLHMTSAGHRNADKIDIEDFKDFRKVYSGHYHIVQRDQNFTFVGSIFQMDRNDYKDQKGIFIIDVENEEEEFVENKVSPVFRKYNVISETDVDGLDALRNSKDYIDLSISNNLLISNRKLRRKLEVLLENSGFSSVDYIDDIVTKVDESVDTTPDEEFDEEKLDISIQLDYADYIKEYINKQKYDNNTFREGVVAEYDEVIKIYNENYSSKKD
jgi:calcineurin-like phosphoesterase family protein